MKKTMKALALSVTVAAALTVSASAASFTTCADALNQMGLFSGTENGYELDRAPTRAEASVMLVRLLGGEKAATENNYETPFTDLPEWAKPYVGWLYENKLTSGASATTFDPEGTCTAQMYSAFLLRSLGYNEAAGDFTYDTAVKFATDKGVADYMNCNESKFLRDHVAAMSYTALSVKPKTGDSATLLDQLVTSGAIDKAKASNTQNTFNTYREYSEATKSMNAETKMAMSLKAELSASSNGTEILSGTVSGNVKADVDLEKIDQTKMAMDMKLDMKMNPELVGEGQDAAVNMDMAAYYTNGNYYVNVAGEKNRVAMSLEDAMGNFNMSEMTNKSEPICLFESIVKNSDGSFNIKYASNSFNDMMDSVLSTAGVAGSDMKINKMDYTVKVKDGKLSGMTMDADMTISAEGQTMDMKMKMDYDITAVGSDVVVELPSDLDSYTSMQ